MNFHVEARAEATVAVIPIPKREASAFGVIEAASDGRIIGFHEKVESPPTMPGNPDMCLASMGNYVFQTESLLRALDEDSSREDSKHDFGHDILPRMVAAGKGIYAYDFATNSVPGEDAHGRGYWRDIGELDAYWQAQMDLIQIHPQFNLYNSRWPIRTGATHDPPAKFVFRDEANARVGIATDSLVSHHLGRAHPQERAQRRVPHQLLQRGRGERALRAREDRAAREAPEMHRRQGRRDPGGHRHRVRPRGGPSEILRERRRARRDPQTSQA